MCRLTLYTKLVKMPAIITLLNLVLEF
jgi:hypothetical protein